jgi:hypothetical protein
MTQQFQITRNTLFDDLPEYLTVDECRTYLSLSRPSALTCSDEASCRRSNSAKLIRVPKAAFEPPKAQCDQ